MPAQQLPRFCPPASADAPRWGPPPSRPSFSLLLCSMQLSSSGPLRHIACERRKCAVNAFARCGLRKVTIRCKIVVHVPYPRGGVRSINDDVFFSLPAGVLQVVSDLQDVIFPRSVALGCDNVREDRICRHRHFFDRRSIKRSRLTSCRRTRNREKEESQGDTGGTCVPRRRVNERPLEPRSYIMQGVEREIVRRGWIEWRNGGGDSRFTGTAG